MNLLIRILLYTCACSCLFDLFISILIFIYLFICFSCTFIYLGIHSFIFFIYFSHSNSCFTKVLRPDIESGHFTRLSLENHYKVGNYYYWSINTWSECWCFLYCRTLTSHSWRNSYSMTCPPPPVERGVPQRVPATPSAGLAPRSAVPLSHLPSESFPTALWRKLAWPHWLVICRVFHLWWRSFCGQQSTQSPAQHGNARWQWTAESPAYQGSLPAGGGGT